MTSFAEINELSLVQGHSEVATLRRAAPQDAELLVSFFRGFGEVAFCNWQDAKCLRRILSRNTTTAYLAHSAHGTVAGAILGGVLGTRGTINHLAVSPLHRSQGLGQCLVTAAAADMKRMGVLRMFLFVDGDNHVGKHFWATQGFCEPRGEITYERDL